ncbi:hypothetical protein EGR_04152 [Echinococcus granulosus]|uniref:Uncharacterized protein n=1 Tax=Echinococcus granulosus TaxID=6210 RepID=W6UII1_ECHGR|nr:hypothetical protein EGR_04152 [Echinococcus granulosus]EUB60906.1 hypothetical protein EGR_04152 [Echinococcus granulosus]
MLSRLDGPKLNNSILCTPMENCDSCLANSNIVKCRKKERKKERTIQHGNKLKKGQVYIHKLEVSSLQDVNDVHC